MAVQGTILARELGSRGGANPACNDTSWSSSRRVNTNATRVIPAAKIQSAPITVLLVSSP